MNGPAPTDSYSPADPTETLSDGRPSPGPAAAEVPPPRFRPHTAHKHGGMGRVRRAADAELDREVAFKDIKPEYADREAFRQRFIFEAEVTGRLEHPGIVPVYGFGRCPAGRPYYAMRFVDGQTLGEAAADLHAADGADRSLALRRLLTRFVSVCQTVAFAHSRGVIHRDLKPDNVMLGPFGETLVLDWGVAKRVRAAAGELEVAPGFDPGPAAAPKTKGIGTPAYWAPEQAAERPDLHDERTDVYGLGAVLFHVLTGRPPHPDGAHPPEPPSPRAVRPWVDDVLDGATRRALAAAREDRFPTAGAVAAEVERWLADQPVAAQRAAVAALADRAAAEPTDYRLAEQLARQRANLGLMLGGMGRDAAAAGEVRAAAAIFAHLFTARGRPRFLVDEANCHLALARCLSGLGLSAEADAANRQAGELYRRLLEAHPDEYRANLMYTLAGPLVPGPGAAAPEGSSDRSTAAPATTPDPNATQDVPPAGPAPDPHPTEPASEPAPPPPTPAAGGFTFLRLIGQGGLGAVWLARDDALGRQVAIKVLSREWADRPRFLREMRVTASLEHPNLIRAYASGAGADGSPYLVMEYLDGPTLLDLIRGAAAPPVPAHLDALAQVCDGLHFAHAAGVVHRDPKPSNVIVLPTGRAVLLDWGSAKVGGQPGTDPTGPGGVPRDGMLTAQGAIVGTPVYMAPEQARGEEREIGPRTDVYVVGASLFHAVTGQTPPGPGGDVVQVLARLVAGDIPRPRDVRPDVPVELDAICAKAMAFRPEDRYPTAAALAADLRAYLAGRAAPAPPRRGVWGWLTGRR